MYPSAHRSIRPAARTRLSSLVARKRQFRGEPLRPVRPIRCRKLDTVGGASIWMTRSRLPTSIPSSRTLVATMTQLSRAANACSACCRCSWLSELCVTNVVTSNWRSSPELLRLCPAVDEDEPLLAAMKPRDHDGGVLKRPHVVERDVGLLASRLRRAGTPDRFRGTSRRASRAMPPGCPPSRTTRSAESRDLRSARSAPGPTADASRGHPRRRHGSRRR